MKTKNDTGQNAHSECVKYPKDSGYCATSLLNRRIFFEHWQVEGGHLPTVAEGRCYLQGRGYRFSNRASPPFSSLGLFAFYKFTNQLTDNVRH